MKFKSLKLGYYLKLAFNGIFKNGVMTFSSIFVLFSCLVIMGTFGLVIHNINVTINNIDDFSKLVVFVKKDATEKETADLKAQLEAIPGIKSAVFKSKEDSLEEQLSVYEADKTEELRKRYENDNPLKDSYILTYDSNLTPKEVNTLDFIIENEKEFPIVDECIYDDSIVEQVDNLKNIFTIVVSWLLVLLFFVSIFVIINTVKLSVFARRDEIALMRYIGATNRFISTPFLIEGVIIGLVASVIAFFAQYFLYDFIDKLIANYQIITFVPFTQLWYIVAAAFAAVGIIMGFLGSYISLRRYNKENA